jgi:hypothetical protein
VGRKTVLSLSSVALIAFFVSGCGSLLFLKSTWLDHDLAAGTDVAAWPGGVTAIGDVVSLGVSNNSEFLYLTLVVQDFKNTNDNPPYANSLAANGLTVWLDPQGADHKAFGIHFRGMEEPESGKPDAVAPGSTAETPEQIQSSDLAAKGLILVDEWGKTIPTAAPALQAFGFEARTSYSGGRFIYVMKLPLQSKTNSPFPSSLAKSKAVGFGFEGRDFNVHRQGGGSGGGSGNHTEKFYVWLAVNLAAKQ